MRISQRNPGGIFNEGLEKFPKEIREKILLFQKFLQGLRALLLNHIGFFLFGELVTEIVTSMILQESHGWKNLWWNFCEKSGKNCWRNY